ncbi:MAG TPA: hypothetical protein VFG47_02405, partial [Geminicoccaceae bacterium]|nr:hypothetical protein [Geminicoccaceae bacterium]
MAGRATVPDRTREEEGEGEKPAAAAVTPPGGYRLPTADDLAFKSIGGINVIGLWTLYLKEVRRFMKVAT